jgi:hypothetical protein
MNKSVSTLFWPSMHYDYDYHHPAEVSSASQCKQVNTSRQIWTGKPCTVHGVNLAIQPHVVPDVVA